MVANGEPEDFTDVIPILITYSTVFSLQPEYFDRSNDGSKHASFALD